MLFKFKMNIICEIVLSFYETKKTLKLVSIVILLPDLYHWIKIFSCQICTCIIRWGMKLERYYLDLIVSPVEFEAKKTKQGWHLIRRLELNAANITFPSDLYIITGLAIRLIMQHLYVPRFKKHCFEIYFHFNL